MTAWPLEPRPSPPAEVAIAHGAARVVLAVPVGSPEAVAALSEVADEVRCLQTPTWLGAIGQFYRDFSQITDAQVVALLREPPPPATAGMATPRGSGDRDLGVEVDVLDGVEERHPFGGGPLEALRPVISPAPPARLLMTAVRTAWARSASPLDSPPLLISGIRPM